MVLLCFGEDGRAEGRRASEKSGSRKEGEAQLVSSRPAAWDAFATLRAQERSDDVVTGRGHAAWKGDDGVEEDGQRKGGIPGDLDLEHADLLTSS